MSALVFWTESKDYSVVPLSDVISSKPEMQKTYDVKYNKSKYRARVLRIGIKLSDFDEVSVTTDGTVVDFDKTVCAKKNILLSPKREVALSKRQANVSKKKEAKSQATHLLTAPTIYEKEDAKSGSPCKDCCQIASLETLNEISRAVQQLKEQLKTTNKGREIFKFSTEKYKKNLKLFPSSSAEVEQVELVSGSGVYISPEDRLKIGKAYTSDPKGMVRSLLKTLIDEEDLKRMSAKGTGGTRGVPAEVLPAIKSFVAKYCTVNPEEKNFTRAINLCIGGIRRPVKSKRSHCENDSENADDGGDPVKPKMQRLSQNLLPGTSKKTASSTPKKTASSTPKKTASSTPMKTAPNTPKKTAPSTQRKIFVPRSPEKAVLISPDETAADTHRMTPSLRMTPSPKATPTLPKVSPNQTAGQHPPNQSYPFPPSQGYSFQPSQGFPFPPSQGYPFPPSQGYPFPPSQGYPFPPSQGYPFPPSHGYPFPPSQGYSNPSSHHESLFNPFMEDNSVHEL